jgi:hypothetical protein
VAVGNPARVAALQARRALGVAGALGALATSARGNQSAAAGEEREGDRPDRKPRGAGGHQGTGIDHNPDIAVGWLPPPVL